MPENSGPPGGAVAVTATSPDLTMALSPQPSIPFGPGSGDGPAGAVVVDDRQTFQPVTGFGATFTDSSAWLVHEKLPADVRAELMDRLFGPGGARLDLLRQPMGATDFVIDAPGSVPYFTYDDDPPGGADPDLAHFSIHHDERYVLPTLREALRVNPDLLVVLTAWTAPAWMKDNRSLVGGGRLERRYYAAWARYYAEAIAAYTAAGIPIWATSGQNEPTVARPYPSMTWSPAEQAEFIADHLHPALAARGLDPVILAGDMVDFEVPHTAAVLTDPDHPVTGIVGGISQHGYGGDPANLDELHARFPSLPIYQTELSPGCGPYSPIEIGIAATRHGAQSVVTWNVALDAHGGPYHTGRPSSCRGLVTVDPARGTVEYGLPFYEQAQFGAFVDRGAVRVASTEPQGSPVRNVAFRNPDGTLVLVAHNGDAGRTHPLRVEWRGRSFTAALPGGASATYRWR